MSFPQAKRWKSAKTKTPARHSATRRGFHRTSHAPTWSQWWHDAAKPLERRRNNGIQTGRGHEANRCHHMPVYNRWAASHGPSPDHALFTMAVARLPHESNKGVSEGFSTLGGKSTRVRRESPSKAPKNGSQIVPCPVRPRRRKWQGVR
nr:MAG TPA: hypothetical protein [Caudoviricetes sp.]